MELLIIQTQRISPSMTYLCKRPLVWVLYRQLELNKLTRPDLCHAVGLFILKDVRLSVTPFYPSALRAAGVLSSRSIWVGGRVAARLAEPISL